MPRPQRLDHRLLGFSPFMSFFLNSEVLCTIAEPSADTPSQVYVAGTILAIFYTAPPLNLKWVFPLLVVEASACSTPNASPPVEVNQQEETNGDKSFLDPQGISPC